MNHLRQFKISEEILASTPKRFLNLAIDIITLSILMFIGLTIYISGMTITNAKDFMDRFMTTALLQYMISSTITLVYYNFFEILTSRTLGKLFTNTIVVDENGDKAHYEAIMIRSLIRIIPLYWISILIFPRRGVHDMFSKTFVVDKRKLEEAKRNFYRVPESETEE